MKKTVTLYIQAVKSFYNDEFKIEINTYQRKSDPTMGTVVIDVDSEQIEVGCPDLKQSDFTEKHVEQLREIKQKHEAEHFIKIKAIDEEIQSLLAIENK